MARKVLYIEDNEDNRLLVKRVLTYAGYEIKEAEDGEKGLEVLSSFKPEIILMDINMPGMDGWEMTARIKMMPEMGSVPIVALTAFTSPGDRERCLAIGCDGYLKKPIDVAEFPKQIDEYLKGKRELLDPALRSAYLKEHTDKMVRELEDKIKELAQKNLELKEYNVKLEQSYIETMAAFINALEAKDPYTMGHSLRVTNWATALAKEMGLGQRELRIMEYAGRLHDIGKLTVDLSYIRKPGPLSKEEWAVMMTHPVNSGFIVSPLQFMKEAVIPIRHHHERYDGQGYPDGLNDGELSIESWILSCADAMDAMLSRRSYKDAYTYAQVISELEAGAGKQFHPEVARTAIRVLQREMDAGNENPLYLQQQRSPY